MLADDLLVGNDRWRMTTLAVEPDGSVMMSVVPSAVSAICPVCKTRSARRHTWYRRTALDLPWRKFTVRLRIWARRFFCDEPSCPRKIFAERFTGLLRHYALPGAERGAQRSRNAGVVRHALPDAEDALARHGISFPFGLLRAL